MSLLTFCIASNTSQGILTDVGFVLREHSYNIVIEGGAHELFRDLARTETVELFGHVDSGTFANGENLVEEFLKLGMNDGSINWQEARSNLGRESLASADKAIAKGRGADCPDTGGSEIAVKELEDGTRLVCGTLFDDRFTKSFMAVDKDLRNYASIQCIPFRSVRGRTYRFTFTKRDTNNIAILLSPFSDLRDVAIAQLMKRLDEERA